MRVLTYMLSNKPYRPSVWGSSESVRFEFGDQVGGTTTETGLYSF
ncbi:MAG: hypothetical protein ACK5MD_11300 [Flavobacteriales bacterium]